MIEPHPRFGATGHSRYWLPYSQDNWVTAFFLIDHIPRVIHRDEDLGWQFGGIQS